MTKTQPRPENEQVNRAAFSVHLGERDYDLHPLTIRKSKEWKAKFGDVLNDFGSTLDIEVSDLGNVIREATRVFGGADDVMLDLLAAHSPVIAENRDEIEETAYPSEAWDALMEVVRVEFPFLRNLGQVAAAQAGAK